jgi:hypothetical protein
VFKGQQNESAYGKSVTITETVFTIWTVALKLFVKNCHGELHGNSRVGLIVDVM